MAESSVRESKPAGFYEFFAGGGMVRAGLGQGWDCLFANDFDPGKGFSYQANWGTGGELHIGVVHRDIFAIARLLLGAQPLREAQRLAAHFKILHTAATMTVKQFTNKLI